jgi:hypothetical protein
MAEKNGAGQGHRPFLVQMAFHIELTKGVSRRTMPILYPDGIWARHSLKNSIQERDAEANQACLQLNVITSSSLNDMR